MTENIKWEYRIEEIDTSDISMTQFEMDLDNNFGDYGWEMCAANTVILHREGKMIGTLICIFKRPQYWEAAPWT